MYLLRQTPTIPGFCFSSLLVFGRGFCKFNLYLQPPKWPLLLFFRPFGRFVLGRRPTYLEVRRLKGMNSVCIRISHLHRKYVPLIYLMSFSCSCFQVSSLCFLFVYEVRSNPSLFLLSSLSLFFFLSLYLSFGLIPQVLRSPLLLKVRPLPIDTTYDV